MSLEKPEIEAIGTALAEVLKVILPAMVAWVVGRMTIANGRQQLELTAANGRSQVAAATEASKLSYRAQVLSANRQVWINDLRDVCSEIVAIMRGGQDALRNHSAVSLEKFERYLQCRTKLKLLLNPTEQATKDFLSAVLKCESLINADAFDDARIDAAFEEICQTCGVILKNEWVRVKEGI